MAQVGRQSMVRLTRERALSLRAEAAIRQAYELFDRYCELSPKSASAEMLTNIMSSEDPGHIADFIAQNVSMRVRTSSPSWTSCARCSG